MLHELPKRTTVAPLLALPPLKVWFSLATSAGLAGADAGAACAAVRVAAPGVRLTVSDRRSLVSPWYTLLDEDSL